jgi:hypothetical protein
LTRGGYSSSIVTRDGFQGGEGVGEAHMTLSGKGETYERLYREDYG